MYVCSDNVKNGAIDIEYNVATKEIGVTIIDVDIFDDYENVTNFFIRASGVGSNKPSRTGIIVANLTRSAKCMHYDGNSPSGDILNPNYQKEQVVLSFLLKYSTESQWENKLKTELKEKLENVLNNVAILDRISLLQIHQVEPTKILEIGLNATATWHLIEFQILFVYLGKINYGQGNTPLV